MIPKINQKLTNKTKEKKNKKQKIQNETEIKNETENLPKE